MACHRYAGNTDVRGAERVEDRDIIFWTSNVRRYEPRGVFSGAAPFFKFVTESVLGTF